VSDWATKWPRDPVRRRAYQRGDRVKFRRKRGTVVDAWRGGDSFTRPGVDYLRVELDNGMTLSCKAQDVRPA
jgi:hypothetical protein